ncbi:MAG: hypothetical protein IPG67_01920 [Acidobacteria bacterium]|nr:hypothetical protein [Acidobacteriota bacterium]
MKTEDLEIYNHIRSGGTGSYEQKRGLIAVWGKEAIQFLDGLISNDMKTLVDGQIMLAAFPNAQGRLLAVVRVLRQGDRFLFETEETTRERYLTTYVDLPSLAIFCRGPLVKLFIFRFIQHVRPSCVSGRREYWREGGVC